MISINTEYIELTTTKRQELLSAGYAMRGPCNQFAVRMARVSIIESDHRVEPVDDAPAVLAP